MFWTLRHISFSQIVDSRPSSNDWIDYTPALDSVLHRSSRSGGDLALRARVSMHATCNMSKLDSNRAAGHRSETQRCCQLHAHTSLKFYNPKPIAKLLVLLIMQTASLYKILRFHGNFLLPYNLADPEEGGGGHVAEAHTVCRFQLHFALTSHGV
jgi:hypothetical protein